MGRSRLDLPGLERELRGLGSVKDRVVRLLAMVSVEVSIEIAGDAGKAKAFAALLTDRAWSLAAAVTGEGNGDGRQGE